jgi:hypothetical protein
MFTFTRLIASVYVVSLGADSTYNYSKIGVLPASKVTTNGLDKTSANGHLSAPTSE